MTLRTLLVFEIVTQSPSALGDPRQGGPVDRPLLRDNTGKVAIPATSLAGSLRAHLRHSDLHLGLLGSEPPEDSSDPIVPSAIRLLGTAVDDRPIFVRHRTAIDRQRGAPSSQKLWTAEAMEAGASIQLFATMDRRLEQTELDAFRRWRPNIGGMASSGRGRARLVDIRVGEVDLADPEGRRRWLQSAIRGMDRIVALTESVDAASPTPPELLVDLEFEILDQLLVDGQTSDQNGSQVKVPMLRPDGSCVLSGTMWKGLARSRAEFVLRSIGQEVCDSSDQPCGTCRACWLFGSIEQRSRVAFLDTELVEGTRRRTTRVAIDRVSGGAADGRLFTTEAFVKGRFRLVAEWMPLANESAPEWAQALLEAVAIDLNDGYLGIGLGTSRGMGTVRLTDRSTHPQRRDLVSLLAEEVAP